MSEAASGPRGAGVAWRYLAGPRYDWAFFLLPPLLSIAAGAEIGRLPWAGRPFWVGDTRTTWPVLCLGALVHAHLVAVVARSHLNAEVFRRHRRRFVLVPILAFVAIAASTTVAIVATALVVLWDVYHSALQTFGLARIYDRLAGNEPEAGRRLDLALNLALYVGPIVGGAALLLHVSKLEPLADIGALFFTAVPAQVDSWQRPLAWSAMIAVSACVALYVLHFVRLARRGHTISGPKVVLVAGTGLCSVWVWGFNPWGQAFFIMNLFHAVQYLALVGWSEGPRLRRRLGAGRVVTALAFLGLAGAYGVMAALVTDDSRLLWSLVQVVSLMHFFYDGFVWSVRRGHVG
jgi:hypothetical protein